MRSEHAELFAAFAVGAGLMSLVAMVVHGMIVDGMARTYEAGRRHGREATAEEVDPADRWKFGATDSEDDD